MVELFTKGLFNKRLEVGILKNYSIEISINGSGFMNTDFPGLYRDVEINFTSRLNEHEARIVGQELQNGKTYKVILEEVR